MKTVVLAIIVITLIIIFGNCSGCSDGIVSLDDWGHGVALCGDEVGADHAVNGVATVAEDDFIWIYRSNVSMLVNDGHQGDPQVLALFKKAKAHCAQYH